MNIEESKSLLSWVSLNKLYIDTHNECDYHNIHTAIETLLTAYARELVKSSELEELLENSVSIDMIKARIEELNDINSKFSQRIIKGKEIYITELVQNILKEILERKIKDVKDKR